MTELAAVVLAHTDPVHVQRLIAALDDVPVFLHCDAKTAPDVAEQMVRGLPRRVVLCDRLLTSRSSWSLVEAELGALRQALRLSSARHIAVLTGGDYPLVPMQELIDQLADWDGYSYFRNVPMPFHKWSTRNRPDGGMWRVQYRFIRHRGQVVHLGEVPLRWPVKRKIPPGLELRASSQWKIYARRHVQLLLRVVESRPDLVRFWRSTVVPEESFVASILGSRAIVGSSALPPCLANAWYLSWPDVGSHPRWMRSADFIHLSEARWAPPIGPEAAVGVKGLEIRPHRKLFARKFSTNIDAQVVDRIDAELRR